MADESKVLGAGLGAVFTIISRHFEQQQREKQLKQELLSGAMKHFSSPEAITSGLEAQELGERETITPEQAQVSNRARAEEAGGALGEESFLQAPLQQMQPGKFFRFTGQKEAVPEEKFTPLGTMKTEMRDTQIEKVFQAIKGLKDPIEQASLLAIQPIEIQGAVGAKLAEFNKSSGAVDGEGRIPIGTKQDIQKLKFIKAQAQSGLAIFREAEKLSKEAITAKTGGQAALQEIGGLTARVPVAGAFLQRKREFEKSMDGMALAIAKVIQGDARISETDFKSARGILPIFGDTVETMERKLDRAQKILSAAQEGAQNVYLRLYSEALGEISPKGTGTKKPAKDPLGVF